MKSTSLLLGAFFAMASLQASASTCNLPVDTSGLEEAAGFEELLSVNPLENLDTVTKQEKRMMADAVNLTLPATQSIDEAVGTFLDVPDHYNAGDIRYFKLDGEIFALVTYYPGDNEYGVVLKSRTSSVKSMRTAAYDVVAGVADSGITCKQ